MLVLYLATLHNSFLFNRFFGEVFFMFFYIWDVVICKQKLFECHLFIFLDSLLWLGLPVLSGIRVAKEGVLGLLAVGLSYVDFIMSRCIPSYS